jgi:hypothetical protein
MTRAALIAALLVLAIAAAPAGAITNGSPDGNGHPNVGGLVADTAFSDGTWIFWGITPAELPAAGSLSKLPGTQQFTSVGYGAYDVTSGAGGGHQYLYNDVRGVATGTLNTTTSAWLKIPMTRRTATAAPVTAIPAGRTSSARVT